MLTGRLAALVLALLVAACQGQTAASSKPSYTDRETPYLENLYVAQEFSGSVLVAKGGHVLLRKGFGLADASRKIANSPSTKFRIGSITKTFTGTAIVMLEQEGRLQLGDSICVYVTPCPSAWLSITLKELLTHTSGIPDYIAPMTLSEFIHPTPPDVLVGLVRDQPLAFPPGTDVLYSNTGYLLLGMVIEKTSGMTYETFLKRRIFDPLGMRSTGLQRDYTTVPGRAVGYGDLATRGSVPDGEAAWSDGGLYSTVDDLYRWDQGLLGSKLLPPAALHELYTVAAGGNIAFGWFVITDQQGHRSIEHTGAIPGFSAILKRLVDQRVTVVMLANDMRPVVGIAAILAGDAVAS